MQSTYPLAREKQPLFDIYIIFVGKSQYWIACVCTAQKQILHQEINKLLLTQHHQQHIQCSHIDHHQIKIKVVKPSPNTKSLKTLINSYTPVPVKAVPGKGHSLRSIPGGLKYVFYISQHVCVITQATLGFHLIKTLFSVTPCVKTSRAFQVCDSIWCLGPSRGQGGSRVVFMTRRPL